jgi:hypothetical protein
MDGVLKTEVRVDGRDATPKIIRLINSTRHREQLRLMMFDGITLAGFNVLDIRQIYAQTRLPVLVINRKRPNLAKVRAALAHFRDFASRWAAIERAGEIKMCRLRSGQPVYYQVVGLDDAQAEQIIQLSSTRSYIPEPLRVAHLIATAIVVGESGGRA